MKPNGGKVMIQGPSAESKWLPKLPWWGAIGFAVLIAIAAFAASGRSQPMPERSEAYSSDLRYGLDPLQRLDVCRTPANAGSRPALLFLPAGGGDKKAFAGACRLAAGRGIVGVPVNYRRAERWPAPLQDAQSAVAWVRAHAAEFNIDPARICALGASAGGYLAVFLAVLTDPPAARIACAIDEFGPVDLTRLERPSAIARLFGPADPATLHRKEEEASPLRLVSKNTAPTLIIQGTLDPYIKPEQSEDLYQALLRAGVQTRLITYAGGHGFQELTREQRLAIWQTVLDFVVAAAPRT